VILYGGVVKIISVVGARPQFVKLAPIDQAFKMAGIEHLIAHTGQHYDPEMSQSFFDELQISPPDFNLGVGSGSHAEQTGEMMIKLEKIFLETNPDLVLLYGDTNSTLAGAIAAVKLKIKIAHLEAGLRSFNRAMPEEHNRILTDHAADLLLAPTDVAMGHLKNEGLLAKSKMVGDVMVDVCMQTKARVFSNKPDLGSDFSSVKLVNGEYFVATIHRAENTDDPVRIKAIIESMQGLAAPVILITHPRLAAKATEFGMNLSIGSVTSVKSVSYGQMVYLVANARGVITDSGGLQKEAYIIGTPCTTVRTETEWPETLVAGWNILSEPTELAKNALRSKPTAPTTFPYGDGHAAERVAKVLLENFS
jgi:UDP-N-acetylglucosamine 2-epimerase (non-hydrolysing)